MLRIGPSKCQSPSLEMKSWFQSSRAMFAFSMNVSMVMPSSEAIAGRLARHQRRARYSSVQGGWQRYIRRQLAFSYSTAASSVGSLSLGYMTLTSLLYCQNRSSSSQRIGKFLPGPIARRALHRSRYPTNIIWIGVWSLYTLIRILFLIFLTRHSRCKRRISSTQHFS